MRETTVTRDDYRSYRKLIVAAWLVVTVWALWTTRHARADVDASPIAVKPVRAFANLEFDRPVALTHAGDGSRRIFVLGQKGLVWTFADDQGVRKAKTFLDIRDRVVYKDKENEEGLLGFAFHPKYAENGEFFLYYTTTDAPHTSVVSRFRVSEDDPDRADADSEEEIFRLKQPFWNHNGGTIEFGPDGYLYVALGDGGLAADPMGNGQNRGTLFGAILRIDVNQTSDSKAYGIPADNPFVGEAGAAPEIWAYGLRNVWRMSFDRKTGLLWAADVGQDLWEEINLIERGGNYAGICGKRATSSARTVRKRGPDLIDPIWEYHHEVGKSITGGHVYRGQRVPELEGAYLYADYVTGKLWGLWYDVERKQVTANREIAGNIMPVMSFGEAEDGEVYFMTTEGRLYGFEQASP